MPIHLGVVRSVRLHHPAACRRGRCSDAKGAGTMKMTVEIDCTPEEARRFMGLPDVEQANAAYVEAMAAAMKGVSSGEQLERYARQLAPMGQFGLKLFQDFMDGAMPAGVQSGMGAFQRGGADKKGE